MPYESTASLTAFIESAPSGSLKALSALAAAESLTDDLAEQLVDLACRGQLKPKIFVSALHLSGFVVERNSEWHISAGERSFLNEALIKDHDLFYQCHDFLEKIAEAYDPKDFIEEVPSYLMSPVGRAYHRTALSPNEGLALYQMLSTGPLNQQWLAARLATEQQEQGILSPEVIEPAFLRGMVLYREGERSQAMRILEPIAYLPQVRPEVAVAAHLVGRRLWKRKPREAERLLRRSLEVGEAINDRYHQAQVLHTLGKNLWKRAPKEAEMMLLRSLKLLEATPDRHGQAQVLHTLGQNVWERDPAKAETLLRRSLKIREDIDDRPGQAQVLHTFGQNLWRRDPKQAERLLRDSLKIEEALNNRHGQAQVLHTLGSKLTETNPDEAERLLRRSLELGEKTGRLRHQAMVLLSLGKLVWPTDPDLGQSMILRSLELNQAAGDREGQRIVKSEIKKRGIDV